MAFDESAIVVNTNQTWARNFLGAFLDLKLRRPGTFPDWRAGLHVEDKEEAVGRPIFQSWRPGGVVH
jgi:hypothetical protein